MKLLFIPLITLLTSTSAKAQIPNSFEAGLGTNIKENIRVSNIVSGKKDSLVVTAFPAIFLRYNGFNIRGGYEWSYSMIKQPSLFNLGPLLKYGGETTYQTNEVGKRRNSLFAGATARILLFNLRYVKDINNKSNGSIFEVIAAYPFLWSKNFRTIPRLGIRVHSSNYNNYYYGVKASEVGEFQQYNANSGTDKFIAIGNQFDIGSNTRLRLTLGYEKLSSEVSNSPTINKSERYFGTVMYTYIL